MLGKLHQIAQGFIHTETDVAHLSSGKIEAMDDLLDSLDEPLIIFAPFRAQVAAAAEAIRKRNDRPVFIYEGRSDVEAWKDSGGVIIGNQASGLGIGQNLQNAAATIYLANSRSPEARIQSLARTDRTGQTRQVRYWDIVSPNTVDETILTSLRDGQDFAENFMRMVRAGEFRRAMGGI
jgi:SNF2 family DNA or RNA helicase